MRFAETNGHEFDYNKHDAWQYRDYVIRAFNQDCRTTASCSEQIAGDLLPAPRLSRTDGIHRVADRHRVLRSRRGAQQRDRLGEVARRQVDNQIDVISQGISRPDRRLRALPRSQVRSDPHGRLLRAGRHLHSTRHSGARVVGLADARGRDLPAWRGHGALRPGRVENWQPRPGEDVFEDFSDTASVAMDGRGQAFGEAGRAGMVNSSRRLARQAAVGSLTSREVHDARSSGCMCGCAGTKLDPVQREAVDAARSPSSADEHKSIQFYPTGTGGLGVALGPHDQGDRPESAISRSSIARAMAILPSTRSFSQTTRSRPPTSSPRSRGRSRKPPMPPFRRGPMVARDEESRTTCSSTFAAATRTSARRCRAALLHDCGRGAAQRWTPYGSGRLAAGRVDRRARPIR